MRRWCSPAVRLLVLVSAGCAAPPVFQGEPGATGQAGAIITVRFEGREGLSAADLLAVVEDNLRDLARTPEREAVIFDAALELEDLYRDAGYPDATVEYTLERFAAGQGEAERCGVVFRIRQGPLVVVRQVEIAGAAAFARAELEALWRRRAAGIFGLGDPLFVAADLLAWVGDVQQHYRSRGYLEAVVDPPIVERHGASALVRLVVHEGPRYEFGRIDLEATVREPLGDSLPELPRGPHTASAEVGLALTLEAALRGLGHPEPRIEIESMPDALTHQVHLQVRGEAGRRATIAAIEVAGNTRTATGVILGKFPLYPGNRYDGRAEDDGLRRLYLSGLFAKVRVERVWVDAERIRITIQVEEIEPRAIELVTGYGSYELLRGAVRLEERNLFGTGRQLALETRASQRGFRSSATLTDPDFLRSDTAMSIGGELFRREEPAFIDEAFGGTVSLARRLLPGLRGRLGYGLRERTDASVRGTVASASLVDYTEGRVFLDFHNEHRDHPLFPRRGHEQFALVEVIDPALGADVEFVRVRAGITVHVPLAGDLRLVLRDEQGFLWPGDGSVNLPLQERFFLGGESTVRSFRESRLGPLDSAGRPVGGEFVNLFSAELRLPLWRSLEAAVFADAGNLGSDVSAYGLSRLRYGLGAGVRLLLPIGPLRVDLAHNPDREPDEAEWIAHLSVGYPF